MVWEGVFGCFVAWLSLEDVLGWFVDWVCGKRVFWFCLTEDFKSCELSLSL